MTKNKIRDTDYLYLSSLLRARENGMLTREKMERILDAPSHEEAARLLVECGYEDMSGMSASGIEEILTHHREEVFAEMERFLPEPEVVWVFRLKYDYHNAKVLVKSEGAGVDGGHLLSSSGRVTPERFIKAYHSEEFSFFPDALRKAVVEAKTVLSRTENPQLADFVLDKAYFAEMTEISHSLSTDFLSRYTATLADSANLRAAVRSVRIGRDTEFLRKALVPGGSRSVEQISKAALSGDGLSEVFIGTVFEEAAAIGVRAAAGGDMTEFERSCDNAVTSFLGSASLVSFGAEPVVAYLAYLENEITAVRMLLTGKLSGVKPEKLRERLRDIRA